MQLYRDFIGHAVGVAVNALKGEPPPRGLQRMDFQVTKEIADFAQTILFSADQALALRPALEDFGERVEYRLPFPLVILQFDHPIPEREFFELERVDESDPALLRRMAAHWAAAGLTLHGWEPGQGDAGALGGLLCDRLQHHPARSWRAPLVELAQEMADKHLAG